MGKVGREASAWRREPLNRGEGSLGERQTSGKVVRRQEVSSQPIAKPPDAWEGAEDLPVEADGRGVAGAQWILLLGSPPVLKFGFRDTKVNMSGAGVGPDDPKAFWSILTFVR